MPAEELNLVFPERVRRTTLYSGAQPGELVNLLPERTIVITDDQVNRLYGKLLPACIPRLILPSGERNKNLARVESTYRELLKLGADRSSFLLGLGGGVICDLAAFTAATFMRGLPCGLVPTTLLAQVDAAIGGKNGVNLDAYKNLVGTINQPRFIFISPVFLATLPPEQLACGFAETIKAAAIADAGLFAFLENNRAPLRKLKQEELGRVVQEAVKIKISLVLEDEFETGTRKKLNFGHTLGHALERAGQIDHGAAVAVGMAAASVISERLGLLSASEKERLLDLLEAFGLPQKTDCPWPPLARALSRDKKKVGAEMDLVLLRTIGSAEIVRLERIKARQYYHDLHKLWLY